MSKLINISNDIYNKLKMMKGKNQSFTIVIENLLEKNEESNKNKIMEFYGKDSFDKERLKELKKGWSRWTKRYA